MALSATSASTPLPDSASPDDFIDVVPGMRWECLMCGKCCGNNYTRTWLDHCVVPITGPLVDNHCQHFDRVAKRCGIYEKRPSVCIGHPFALVRSGDLHRFKVHRHCPGIGCGPILDRRTLLISLLDRISELYDMDFIVDWSTLEDVDIVLHRIR